jgi:hypothetical protein
MSAEGATLENVLAALVAKGCVIDDMSNGLYRVGLKAVIQVHQFTTVVSRTKIQSLCRLYGISIPECFPPIKPSDDQS